MSSSNGNNGLDVFERRDVPDDQQAQIEEEEEEAVGEHGGEDDIDSEGEENQGEQDEIANLYQPLNDNGPMTITELERNLAINIQQAILATPDMDPVSDFMCVQLALIDGDNTENAVGRAYHLQCFREEYGIVDSTEAGCRCFAAYLELFPRVHLSFAEAEGSYVMVYDNTAFDSTNIRSEEDVRTWLGGSYYTVMAFCPDFRAIKSGTVCVFECEGYDWKKGVDFKSLKRVWSELATVYPVNFSKLKYFHAGTTMNLVASLLKPFLPKHLRRKIEFGCQFPVRLDQVYLVPTEEEANSRFLRRIEDTLTRRFENERNFHL